MSTLVKKLTVKHICGEIIAPAVGDERPLCILMGYAKSTEKKMTSFGESTAFHGDFKGVSIETGEEFRAGTCYLPDVAASLLENALEDNDGVVEFGFQISVMGVKGRTDAETGKYEYRCKPLMKAAENDPMLALENKLRENAMETPPKAAKPKGGK